MQKLENLPDDVRSKLKTDPRHTNGNELLPAEVAATMQEHKHERPIWTASRMQAELSTGHGRETVRDKLKKLDEVGICGSMAANNGRIYWWNDERSDWPIPSDVVVEGQQELTVAELVNPWYAKLALIGLLAPAIAGLPLLLGVFAIDGAISIPISGSELLTIGLTIIVLSYLVLVYSVLLGIMQWTTGDKIDLTNFWDK